MSDITYRLTKASAEEIVKRIIELTAHEQNGYYRGDDHLIATVQELIDDGVAILREKGLLFEGQ